MSGIQLKSGLGFKQSLRAPGWKLNKLSSESQIVPDTHMRKDALASPNQGGEIITKFHSLLKFLGGVNIPRFLNYILNNHDLFRFFTIRIVH